jgi:hypothetical protein
MVIKGRHTIRSSTASSTVGRKNRLIEPWILEAKAGTTTAKLESIYLEALAAVDKFGEHKAAAIKSGKFTPDGLRDETLTFALTQLVPTFHRARQLIAQAKREAAELRDKIKLQPVDKADVVGFLQRKEIRDWLLAMPAEKRGEYLTRNVDKLDPAVALAVMEAPADMGVAPESVRTILTDRALEAQHGEVPADLRDLETAIGITESAAVAGREEIAHENGIFDTAKFDELAAPFEKGKVGPWLKKVRDESGVEIIQVFKSIGDGKFDWRLRNPTAEELATGEFYADHYAYAKAHGVAPV